MNVGTQLTIEESARAAPRKPRAATLQPTVSAADNVLTSIARKRGHNVLWWWGIRRKPRRMCAFCYVCDHIIITGALNAGITNEQAQAIDAHRLTHWEEVAHARAKN